MLLPGVKEEWCGVWQEERIRKANTAGEVQGQAYTPRDG